MLVAVVLALTAIPAIASAGVESASFYTLPPATHAYSMTAGPEGAIWFTGAHSSGYGSSSSIVGRVKEGGEVTIFDLPSKRTAKEIVAGPDGNLWFTETFHNRAGYTVLRIGRMTPSGNFNEYEIGNYVGGSGGIATGPDGNLWFVSVYWQKGRKKQAIGRIGVSGKLKRFPLPPRSGPTDIVAGPDGNMWFTERGAGTPKIGRISPRGRITRFPLPNRKEVPGVIAAGPDGNLWFSVDPAGYVPGFKSRIGRIDPSGAITEFRLPENGVGWDLVAGPAGRLWYTSYSDFGNLAIGSLTPDGAGSELACLPSREKCELDADSLAIGADGALWFSASRYYPHRGGGGSGIAESLAEEAEAGFVGRFAP